MPVMRTDALERPSLPAASSLALSPPVGDRLTDEVEMELRDHA